jgi:hypothetical protein
MSTLSIASNQWASRPDDQRFESLIALDNFTTALRNRSASRVISSRKLEAAPLGEDHKGLVVYDPKGVQHDVTHWAFGQLANRAGAPASYLRDLPSELAADCVNYGLKYHRDVEELGVLSTDVVGAADSLPSPAILRAVTGPNYGRIWNSTITNALVKRFGDGITGDFKVPGEFGKEVAITKANTTLYASDRDMFVFLADEKRRIEIPNRRAGMHGTFARGFIVWNSEVGDTTLGFAMFLYDYVCCNRMIWGAQDYQELRIRHTAGAPDRWLEEVSPTIEAYSKASDTGIVNLIEVAQATKLESVDDFLKNRRFTKTQVSNINAAFLADEQRPMESVFDVVTGITAYARAVPYQDERVRLEREAGKVLNLAA